MSELAFVDHLGSDGCSKTTAAATLRETTVVPRGVVGFEELFLGAYAPLLIAAMM